MTDEEAHRLPTRREWASARCQVAFAEPIPANELPPTPQAAGELIENRLWAEVTGSTGVCVRAQRSSPPH